MFHGSIVALVTPMLADQSIDYQAFSNLLDWHIAKTDGIVVLGTTGESPTIEKSEREQLIKLAVARAKNKIPIIVGTGSNSTQHTIQMTEEAMTLGADAALVVTPYYNKPTQEGLYQHFKRVAEAVSLPQILYNVPSRTGCDLLPETVVQLAKLTNIVAIKEATGDMSRVHYLNAHCDMNILSGDDTTALSLMLAGGKGVISVAANIVPESMYQLCKWALAGEKKAAEGKNQELISLYKLISIETNPIPTKWALTQMKLIEGGIRLPLTTLNQKFHPFAQETLKMLNINI